MPIGSINRRAWKNMARKIILITAIMLMGGFVTPRGEGADSAEEKYGVDMVFVEGGTFIMGCDPEEEGYCDDAEKPAHKITLTGDFYIGKYEVTQKQWQQVMGSGLREQRDKAGDDLSIRGEGDAYPIYYVSWYEAVEFCNKLSEITGRAPAYRINHAGIDGDENGVDDKKPVVTAIPEANGYRLPTEAEWEYAARGGNRSAGYRYCGSDDIREVAWYDANSEGETHPVGTKKANELGIHDMTGNVDEWVFDGYGFSYYANSPDRDPQGPGAGASRVIRGGSWYIHSRNARASIRYGYSPGFRGFNLGFRLAAGGK